METTGINWKIRQNSESFHENRPKTFSQRIRNSISHISWRCNYFKSRVNQEIGEIFCAKMFFVDFRRKAQNLSNFPVNSSSFHQFLCENW